MEPLASNTPVLSTYDRLSSSVNDVVPVKSVEGTPTSIYDKTVTNEYIKNIKPNTINGSYDPSAALMQVYTDDIDSFRPFYPTTGTPFIMGRPEAYEGRARAQNAWALTGNIIAQTIGETVGGTISGVGALLRPDKWLDRINGTGEAFERTLLEDVGEKIMNYGKEIAPIYQTNAAEKGLAWGDKTWWASLTPSVIGSAISIMVPARLAAILPSKLLRIAATEYNFGKVTQGVNAIMKDANAISKASGSLINTTKLDYWSTVAFASIAGRVIDSTRESLGKYEQYYQEQIALGIDDKTAREYAADAASSGFKKSHANIVFDLVQWGMILKTGNYLTKGTSDKLNAVLGKTAGWSKATLAGEHAAKTGMSRAASFGLQTGGMMLSEGADEMTMDIAQSEGRYQADIKRGFTQESTFGQRLGQHLDTKKNWDSFVGGALGGLFMMPLGQMMERIGNKKGITRMQEHADQMITNAEQFRVQLEDISEAVKEGNKAKAQILRSQLIMDIATKGVASNSTEFYVEMLNNIAGKTNEELEAEGINPDIVEHVPEMIQEITQYKKTFEAVADVVGAQNREQKSSNFYVTSAIARTTFLRDTFKKHIDAYNASGESSIQLEEEFVKNSLGNDIAFNYYKLLKDNKELNDTHTEILAALNQQIAEASTMIARMDSFLLNNKKATISKSVATFNILGAKKTINNSTKAIEQLTKKLKESNDTHAIALEGYKDIDAGDKTNVSKMIDRLKEKDNPYSDRVQIRSYEAQYAIMNKLLGQYSTPEGRKELEDDYDKHIELTKERTKSNITSEVNNIKTLKELDALHDKYKKSTLDPEVYTAPINARKTILKNEETNAKQEARRKAENVSEESVDKTPKDSVEKPVEKVVTNQLKGSEAATLHPSNGDGRADLLSSSIQLSISNLVASSDVASSNELNSLLDSMVESFREPGDSKTPLKEDELIDDFFNNPSRHLGKLVDLLFTDEFAKRIGLKLGKGVTFNVAEFYNNKDKYLKNETIKLIHEALLLLGNKISDSFTIVPDPNNTSKSGNKFILYAKEDGNLQEAQIAYTEMLDSLPDPLSAIVGKAIRPYMDTLEKTLDEVNLGFNSKELDDDAVNPDPFQINTVLADKLSKAAGVMMDSTVTEDALPTVTHATNILKAIVRKMTRERGKLPSKITVEDILKYLRDSDKEGNPLATLEEWADKVVTGVRVFEVFNNLRVRQLEGQIAKVVEWKESARKNTELNALNAKLRQLQAISNMLDLKGFRHKVTTGFNKEFVFDTKFTPEILKVFLKMYPKQTDYQFSSTGIHGLINVFNEKGEMVEVSGVNREILTNETIPPIYKHLSELIPGMEVSLHPDDSYEYTNRAKDEDGNYIPYDWSNRPIRVKLPNDVSEDTVFWIRTLSYMSGGIQYGRKVTNEDGSVDHVFRGVSSVMTGADFHMIANDLNNDTSIFRDFYKGYTDYQKFDKNNKENKVDKKAIALNRYTAAFQKIIADKTMLEMFLRVINLNSENSIETISEENVARVLDAIFYGVKSENYEVYTPNATGVRNSFLNRDRKYEADFNMIKLLREDLRDGNKTKVTIERVSTPSVLIEEEHRKDGVLQPRTKLMDKIKPTTLEGETVPRIVIVRFDGNNFVDLDTGRPIKDSRFKSSKAQYNFENSQSHRSGMFVLLQAPNGDLVAFDTKANTVGLSGKDDYHRELMVGKITNSFVEALSANTQEDMWRLMNGIRHIVIYDEHTKPQDKDAKGKDKIGFKHLQTGFFNNGNTRWIKFSVINNNREKGRTNKDAIQFYRIENTNGIINIYSSYVYSDIYTTKETLTDEEAAYRETFNIANNKGYEHLKNMSVSDLNVSKTLETIVPNMLRQTHLDIKEGTFSYDKNYSGEEVVDQADNAPYKTLKDYYLETGSIYTDAGAVTVTEGDQYKVITNFDITGRFPLSVSLSTQGQSVKEKTYNTISELVEDNVISKNDEYLGIILELERELGSKFVNTVVKRTVSNNSVARTVRATNKKGVAFSNKYSAWLFDTYFKSKSKRDVWNPATSNILHEMLHMYMNSRYDAKPNESPENAAKRVEAIKKHNEGLTEYITDLNNHWNSLTKEEQSASIAAGIGITNTKAINHITTLFNKFLEIVNKDMDTSNASVTAKLSRGEALAHEDTIQEIITYAYSNPAIVAVLNSLETEETYADTSNNKRVSFWDKLKDSFFEILERVFGITYNNKSEYAKLNSMINSIYSTRIKTVKESVLKTKKAEAADTDTVFEENPVESDLDIITEYDADELGLNTKPDDESGKDSQMLDTDTSQSITSDDFISDGIDVTNLLKSEFTDLNSAILDANGHPIC